jgi:uncharacterized protein (TIGR02284 family)
MNTALMEYEYPAMQGPFGNTLEMPPSDGDAVCEVLREAIEVLRDREESFRQAADLVSTPSLQNEMMSYSAQRALFVGELQGFERELGRSRVDEKGTVSAALHRAWVGLKTAIAKRSDKSILNEMAEGEKGAADFYVSKLATCADLPMQVSQCLSRQCAELQKGQIELRNQSADCRD